MGIPIGGGGGGGSPVPNLTCAQAKSEIASLTMTVANLQSLLARTQDPVQRADIQAGISEAQQEIAVLRNELPLLCAPPAPSPSISVLIVLDGADASFATPDSSTLTPDGYFTLSYFQSVLQTQGVTVPGLPIVLTRAHRQQDPALTAAPATLPSGVINNAYFTWHSDTLPSDVTGKTVVDLSSFNVVLMFGFVAMPAAGTLNPNVLAWDGAHGEDQLWAFVQFMNNGGGLFATGDHEDLGAPIGAAIPRVRSMRRWLWQPGTFTATEGGEEYQPGESVGSTGGYGANFLNNVELTHPFNSSQGAQLGMRCAPPSEGELRHDTLQAPPQAQEVTLTDPNAKITFIPGPTMQGDSPEPFIPFDRQSDDIPQPIMLTQPGHPLFVLSSGAPITVYPDHMHEGMTIDLSDTTNPDPRTVSYTHQGVTIQEYPSNTSAGQPVPQILMNLTTTGGHATPSGETYHLGALDPTVPSVTFGGVSAYDGSPVGVGRIVTDSTFHHYVDINLIGDPGVAALGVGPAYAAQGFQGSTTGQGYLAQFAAYWLNLVNWLANPQTATALLMAAVKHASQSATVRKSAGPGVAGHGSGVHDFGSTVTQLVSRLTPAPMLRDALQHAMSAIGADGVANWLADARAADPDRAADIDRVLLHGFLGGAVLHSLGLGLERSLDAEAAAVEPAVRAGLAGAAKALAASRHGDAAGELVSLLSGKVLA